MIEVVILAVALSMDAFAVSIGLGAQKKTAGLVLKAGLYFGIAQAMMPLLGYLAGLSIVAYIGAYANWLAFGLLTLIGLKMIYESFYENKSENIPGNTNKMMVGLAIATSIDAMVAGFSLTLLNVNLYISCLTIGLVTFLFSALGILLGRKGGGKLGSRADIFGGAVLILLGMKMVAFT